MRKSFFKSRLLAGSIVKINKGLLSGKYGIVLYSFESKSKGQLIYKVKYAGKSRFFHDSNMSYVEMDEFQLVRKPSIWRKAIRPWRSAVMKTISVGTVMVQAHHLLPSYPMAFWLLLTFFGVAYIISIVSFVQSIMWGDKNNHL